MSIQLWNKMGLTDSVFWRPWTKIKIAEDGVKGQRLMVVINVDVTGMKDFSKNDTWYTCSETIWTKQLYDDDNYDNDDDDDNDNGGDDDDQDDDDDDDDNGGGDYDDGDVNDSLTVYFLVCIWREWLYYSFSGMSPMCDCITRFSGLCSGLSMTWDSVSLFLWSVHDVRGCIDALQSAASIPGACENSTLLPLARQACFALPMVNCWQFSDLDSHLPIPVLVLEKASTVYGMQISAKKTQLMTNNTNGISTDITIDNKKLETVRSFKYLGAIVSDEGSKPEVLSRIAQTTAVVTKLKVTWNEKNIAISSKIRLMRSLFMPMFLYACETWTITADIKRRIQDWRWDVSANSSVSRTEIT